MTVVVDASVIVKWVLPERGSDSAAALRTSALLAPSFWLAEAGNVLWQYVVRGWLSAEAAQMRLGELRAAPLTSIDLDEDIDAALKLAADLNHPVYDCLYLALAMRKDSYVVTDDRRFAALADRRADLKGRIRALT